MKKYYIAYGSNLNVHQMKFRCPDATIAGTAVITGYRLMFKGSLTGSYLTIEQAKGYKVPVGVWEVSEQDEINLDRYEGYPNFYYKADAELMVRDAKTGNLTKRNCFIYIMHEYRKLGIPSRSYMDICFQGYKDFGFKKEYLVDAYKYSIGDKK
ncbi:gamma-glutamylcyclotransferase family protein [Phascolarctobacterium sp.]|uniref:gamma-glutamylcyclotransferase family protein n=1 Tax=Phascolarctobacterium sp. TaxID=2049039 RepID=UPI002A7EB59D|nr:gamma-glutamylcyclotransferase family protein [Phascolarctobacterium sp.]MDY5045534.1 gamma-glutamylcyclotransferase family protein [Phascolarctobacterium sp.]